MFSMGGGVGGPMGGPSSMASNAAAGLPAADVPGELRRRVEDVLDHEPEHDVPNVGWRVDDWDRDPFSLLRFLRPHRWRLLAAISLVLIETIALQLGPVLTQIGIDDGVRQNDRGVVVTVALVYVGAVVVAAGLGWARVSFTGRLGESLNEQLRIRVFSHMQRQGLDWYTDEKAGVLLTRMTSDIEALSVLF